MNKSMNCIRLPTCSESTLVSNGSIVLGIQDSLMNIENRCVLRIFRRKKELSQEAAVKEMNSLKAANTWNNSPEEVTGCESLSKSVK